MYLESKLPTSTTKARGQAEVASTNHGLAPMPAGLRFRTNVQRTRMAITYVESHYHELIREEEVAGLCAMSISSFCRIFKKEHGQTFRKYLMGFRINKTRKLLQTPGTSVKQVALATGFNDMSYFARVFRQMTGETPSAFQQSRTLKITQGSL